MQLRQKIIVPILLLSTLSFSCLFMGTTMDSKFGTEYNIEREKISLPPIPSDWVIDAGSSFGESTWYAPDWERDYDKRTPVHVSKYVNFASGEIDYETDKYSGKGDWDCEEDVCRESLFITYCYRVNSQCKEQGTWQVIYQSQETTGFGREFISFEEATSILNDWGLDYP